MNSKQYIADDKWSMAIISIGLLLCGVSIIAFFVGWWIIDPNAFDAAAKLMCILVMPLVIIATISSFHSTFHRAFGWLTVEQNAITWRCPLYKTVKLGIEDCVYVDAIPLTLPRSGFAQELHDRAGTFYICLSKNPISKKTKKTITNKPPKKGFIWFPYSDALCLHLIEVLPDNKTYELVDVYSKMQDKKRLREREEAARKRRKEKEKQRKKK